jgi:hypothetical protein
MDIDLLPFRDGPTPTARAFVIYERRTGRVLHIHHTETFGQERQINETPEQQAIRLAGERGAKAQVLEVDPNELSIPGEFTVNVRAGRLERRDFDARLKRALGPRKGTSRRRKAGSEKRRA